MDTTHSNQSQAAAILRHLQAGRRITPAEALAEFHCGRLGARIWELKQEGHPIQSRSLCVGRSATGRPVRVAQYFLSA